jgi:hypothetical protein
MFDKSRLFYVVFSGYQPPIAREDYIKFSPRESSKIYIKCRSCLDILVFMNIPNLILVFGSLNADNWEHFLHCGKTPVFLFS